MLISSTDEGSFVSGSIVWKTPQALHALVSGVNGSQISFGLNSWRDGPQRSEATLWTSSMPHWRSAFLITLKEDTGRSEQ